ncbi:MAG: DUF2341 domain-containing protein [Candidatus Aenigmarchaeota archaeon]|nr:DUF2341 domain-containing protein [Candidatus Aenigmarchaeota archaeon]
MSSTYKSQGTASSLFIVFSVILFSLTTLFVLTVFASSEFIVYTNKGTYNPEEPIVIVVEGPPFTEFYLTVLNKNMKQVFPIGDPLWKLNSHGMHNFYLEGFSESGMYTAKVLSGEKNTQSTFYVASSQTELTEEPAEQETPASESNIQIQSKTEEKKVIVASREEVKEIEISEKPKYGLGWEEVCKEGKCTKTISSYLSSMQDSEGEYRPFNELVKLNKKSSGSYQYLEIDWNSNKVGMDPYAVINRQKVDDLPPSMSFNTITKEIAGQYKWSYEFRNIHNLEAIGIKINSNGGILEVVDDDTIIIDGIELDFSDLYNSCDEYGICTDSGIMVSIDQIDLNTADVRITNFEGTIVLLDPTIKLQTADTQNLDDSHVRSNSATSTYGTDTALRLRSRSNFKYRSYVKFNISSIPSAATIQDSKLCLYLYSDDSTPSAGAYHVYDYTWTEEALTWNNQPCGTNFDSTTNCNITAENTQTTSGTGWICWNITKMVATEKYQGDENVSVAIKTTETDGNVGEDAFYSKEYTTDTSLRPYLNITYEMPPAITSVANSSTTDISTLITWTTDKNANSSVVYGNTTSLLDGSNSSATFTTAHSIQLTNLNPQTLYYYNVTSCGLGTKCNTTGPYNFTTSESPDATNPIASLGTNPVANYNDTDGSVTFDLKCSDNRGVGTLQLWSDWTGSWSANQTNSSPVNNSVWSVLVEGIPEGIWSWGAHCNDTSGNEGWTDLNRTITIDTKPPQITSVTNSSTTFDHTDIVWTTNEPANSSIIYGKIEFMEDGYESSTSLIYSHSLYIENLDSETLYYYNVTSCDFIGNCNTTGPYTFKTARMPEAGIPLVYLGGEPQNYFNSSSGNVEFEIKCIDDGEIDSLQLWSDWSGSWSGNETNSTSINDTWWSFSVSGIPEGTWIWGASCSDKEENTGWSALNRTLTIDLAHPEISLQDPEPFYNTTSQDVNFIFRATDNMATVLSCSLYINGSFSAVNSSVINGSLTTFEKTGLSEGLSQDWAINCTDYAGNSYQAPERHFSIDATPPITSFENMPIDNYNYSSRSLLFELYCIDNTAPHTLQLWSDWSGSWSANQTNSSPVNNSVWSVLVEGIPEGIWSWGAYCKDTLGNSDWTDVNRTLTIDITKPQITDVTNESITHTSTIISWNTDEPANSSISYGRTEDLNEGISYSSNFVFFHQASLSSLLCDTLYYYNITSCDFAGNCDTTGPYSFRTKQYQPLLVNTVTACAAHDSKARGTFDIACDAPDGSYLESNDGNYEDHTYTKSLYAGVRIESVDAEETKCYGIESVYICYEWWGTNTPQDCDISVDADGGASYTVASSTCPGTIADPGPQCLDVTSLETWTCQNFFGPTGTRAVAKSEFRRTSAGGGSTEIAYWDILYFNVSYLADIKPPEVVLNNPADNFNSSSGDIYFNCTGFDEVNLTSINLYGSWGPGWHLNATNDSVINNTLTTFNVKGIKEGTYEWNCYACGNFTNCQFYSVNYTITVDTTAPTVSLSSPIPDFNTTSESIDFIFTATDNLASALSCDLIINGSVAGTNSSTLNGTLTTFIQSSLSEGLDQTWAVNCSDSAQNSNQPSARTFSIDRTGPSIAFPYYANATKKTSSQTLTINLSVTDTGLGPDICLVHIEGQSANQTIPYVSGWCNGTISLTNANEGNSTIYAYANDTLNNFGLNSSYVIYIDDSPPIISSVTNASTTNETTLITWSTNEPANSSVIYGTDNTTLSDGSNSSETLTSSHSLALKDLTQDTMYYYNVTSCDSLNNCITEGPYSFKTALSEDDFDSPVISLILPLNNSGDNDGNVSFSYNVTDDSSILNCSLILNGQINQTNSTVQKTITQYFNVTSLPAGHYNWSIRCTDDSPNENTQTTASRNIDMIIYSAPVENFTMTDLSQVDTSNITDFYIEIENKTRLIFNETLDLSGGLDLSSIITIQSNFIDVDTASEPRLNKSAEITFHNLSYIFNPVILRNGKECPSSICMDNYYNLGEGVLRFNVTQFTNYSSSENSRLEIWDSGDEEGGLNIHNPGDIVAFYANYTNLTSSESINGTGINCTINFEDGSINMTFNESSAIYWYNRTFTTAGLKEWNVSCNGSVQDYEPLIVTETITIYEPWWNDSWKYRIPVTIENYSYVLEDFQVLITIDSSSAPENWNWSQQNGVRFVWVNDSGDIEIPHYTPYWSAVSEEAQIWIKMPEISNVTNETVHLYYENPSASDTSNATKVYDVYNDFESGMDYFTQRNTDGGACSLSGGRLVCDPNTQWSGAYAYTDYNFTTKYGYYIEFRMWKNQSTSGSPPFGFSTVYMRKPYPDLGYETTYYYTAQSSSLIIEDRVDTGSYNEQQTYAKWNNGTFTGKDDKSWAQYDNQPYDYIVVWDTDSNILSQNVTHNGTLHSSQSYIPESVITDIGSWWKLEVGTFGYYDTNAEYDSISMRKYIADEIALYYGEEETSGLVLSVTSPSNTSYSNATMTYSGYTNNNATIRMSINGNDNYTFCSSCTSFGLSTSENVTEGSNNVTFWAISTANTSVVVNETVWFYLDTIVPEVEWNPEATESGTQSNVEILINCSFDETNPHTKGYQFNGTNSTSWDGNDGMNYWVVKNSLEFGNYNDIYCWINDTLGHYNETSKREISILWLDWWDADWTLRTPISLEEKADKYDLINMTFMLSINTSKLYNEGKIRDDCGDIRFVYNESHKEIPYNFTECEITGGNTTFWIMFDLDRADTMLLYMYYNNSEASATRQTLKPYDTEDCTFFDSLDGSTAGSITGSEFTDYEWVTDGRGAGMLYELTSSFENSWAYNPGSEGTIEFWLKLDEEINTSSTVSAKTIISSGRNGISFDQASGANNVPGHIIFGISPSAGFYSEIYTNQDKWYEDNFYHIAVTWDGSTQSIYVNGTLDKSQTQTRAGGWGSSVLTNRNSNWGSNAYKISNVRLCPAAKTSFQYVVYPEPNSTIQPEETVPFLDIGSPVNTTYYSYLVEIFGETAELSNVSWSMNGNTNQTSCYNCTTFSNITSDFVVQGLNNITIYANSTETSTKESETIWFTVDILNINMESPMNHSGDSDGDIIFEYNLTGNRGINNCSLILNGQLNQTNTSSLSKDTKLNFTLNDLPVAGYNWTVNCTASDGQIVGGNISYAEVIYTSDFGGSTTDLSTVDIRNIASFTIENPDYGKIVYTPNIDLSGGVNLNSVIDILYNGTYVNSSADSRLNVSATVSIYNLTYKETPVILRDGTICSGSMCSFISYNPSTGLFIFTVSYFSNYSSTENAGLAIWDSTDPEGGSNIIFVGQPLMIYTNYTDVTDSQPITGSGVYCNLTASGSEYQMDYNATTKLYEYSHTFYDSGNQTYYVFCNGSSMGYEPINLTDNATIEGTSLEVELITPPTIPGDGDANMSVGYIVGANRTFVINATVICRQGYCAYVNATVRYNKSSTDPDTNVPVAYTPGEAFFMQDGMNTKNCSENPLDEDEWCNITWTINASADLNTIWKIDVMFNSSVNRTNTTDMTQIQIGKILLMDLSYEVIDFGILNPDGEETLYPAINSSNMTYNVTVDQNSNDIEELWVMGTHLTNGTIDYNRFINVSRVKWARSYLGDNPVGDPNLYNLTLSFDKVNKDTIPIYSGTNETMYFWIDSPGGVLPLTYTGTLTIMGNATF